MSKAQAKRMNLTLSVFPGWADLLGRGFSDEGFCVVRGPDIVWGQDIRDFHVPSGRFAGVIGGPPCQRFCSIRKIIEKQGARAAEDLIPEFARIVGEARPRWFLMENVEAAYEPHTPGYHTQTFLLDCRVFGVRQKRRIRSFTFGALSKGLLVRMLPYREQMTKLQDCDYSALASEGRRGKLQWKNGHKVGRRICKTRPWAAFCQLQGLPDGYDMPGLLKKAKYEALGNGVPLPVARGFARAIREATENR